MTGRDDLTEEGKAQQDKADAQKTPPKRKQRPKPLAQEPKLPRKREEANE